MSSTRARQIEIVRPWSRSCSPRAPSPAAGTRAAADRLVALGEQRLELLAVAAQARQLLAHVGALGEQGDLLLEPPGSSATPVPASSVVMRRRNSIAVALARARPRARLSSPHSPRMRATRDTRSRRERGAFGAAHRAGAPGTRPAPPLRSRRRMSQDRCAASTNSPGTAASNESGTGSARPSSSRSSRSACIALLARSRSSATRPGKRPFEARGELDAPAHEQLARDLVDAARVIDQGRREARCAARGSGG